MLTKIWNSTPRALLSLVAVLLLATTAVAQQTTPAQKPRQTQPGQPSQPAQPTPDQQQPATTQPATTQPATTEPATAQPATTQSAAPADAAQATSPQAGASVTIVEAISKTGNHTTLTKAIEVAGLTETLKGAGPYTVFAPTDEAFAKLPAGALEELLKPENKEKLVAVLTYHVVAGNVTSAEVAKMKTAQTAQGSELTISSAAEGVKVGNAMVKQADVTASNGTIHVIDTVLMPSGGAKAKGGAKKTP